VLRDQHRISLACAAAVKGLGRGPPCVIEQSKRRWSAGPSKAVSPGPHTDEFMPEGVVAARM